jgi:Zn-dependent protease with chaperone function
MKGGYFFFSDELLDVLQQLAIEGVLLHEGGEHADA